MLTRLRVRRGCRLCLLSGKLLPRQGLPALLHACHVVLPPHVLHCAGRRRRRLICVAQGGGRGVQVLQVLAGTCTKQGKSCSDFWG